MNFLSCITCSPVIKKIYILLAGGKAYLCLLRATPQPCPRYQLPGLQRSGATLHSRGRERGAAVRNAKPPGASKPFESMLGISTFSNNSIIFHMVKLVRSAAPVLFFFFLETFLLELSVPWLPSGLIAL